jgi:EAL domain-containing protein (putative c-di-GMP-specific phosphodiesterase class I)
VTTVREDSNKGRFHINVLPATLLDVSIAKLRDFLIQKDSSARFTLEISEQQLLGSPTYLAPRVRELQRADIPLALGDVGFGSRPLESIVLLRPRYIKVDRKLIHGVSRNNNQLRNLRRLLDVADSLRSKVIALGIQDEDDLQILRELDVPYGQGFYFGKPEGSTEPEDGGNLAGLWSWICSMDKQRSGSRR